MSYTLDADFLSEVLAQLKRAGAKVQHDRDDYGNPVVAIRCSGDLPVLIRHSVIGGEEIATIDGYGAYRRCPTSNGDPFGPIDDASAETDRLWQLVVAEFPEAAVR